MISANDEVTQVKAQNLLYSYIYIHTYISVQRTYVYIYRLLFTKLVPNHDLNCGSSCLLTACSDQV